MNEEYEIIDCHIHPAIDESTDFQWFGRSGDFGSQAEALKRAGISHACGSPVKQMTQGSFDEVRTLNDQTLQLRDRYPDFFTPGIQIHPHFREESCREIERCCGTEGVRWIGELVGYIMDYGDEYATEDALAVMRSAQAHDAVVNFHCHDLAVIHALCTTLPELKLVLAHPSDSRAEILERVDRLVRYPNLHLDISGSGIDRYGILRKAIDTAGPEKLLFGTDYPINNPAVYVHGVLFESLTEDERQALFHDNFRRLIGS